MSDRKPFEPIDIPYDSMADYTAHDVLLEANAAIDQDRAEYERVCKERDGYAATIAAKADMAAEQIRILSPDELDRVRVAGWSITQVLRAQHFWRQHHTDDPKRDEQDRAATLVKHAELTAEQIRLSDGSMKPPDGYSFTNEAGWNRPSDNLRFEAAYKDELIDLHAGGASRAEAECGRLRALLREAVGVLGFYADKGKYTPPANWQYNSDAENYTVLADKGAAARAFLSREDVKGVGG